MRLLFVVHQFMPDFAGGTERVTLNLARAAQADGNHVEVLTVSTGRAPGWRRGADGLLATSVEGVPVFALPVQEPPLVELGLQANPALAEAAERFLAGRPDFDVAHVMHALRMTEAVEALAARRVPYVVTLTDFFSLCYRVNLVRLDGSLCGGPAGGQACRTFCRQPQLAEPQYAARTRRYGEILRRASAVAAVSDYVAERVRAEHPDLKVFVVRNGIALLRFRPPQRVVRDGLTIGYLGTVSAAKGALLLAEAFAAAKAPGARLRIVGPCHAEDRVVGERIAQLAKSAPISLEDPIAAAEVPAFLSQIDLLAVPSQVPESFSLALHEGFAAGLPALVSDIGNAGAVVAASSAGRPLPSGDVAAWAEAIREAAADPQAVQAWAAAAPLPWRVEEEAFAYSQLYRAATTAA